MTATSTFQSVCVIGLGYIGLPTAAFVASKGINVIGVDVNEKFVNRVNAGEVPFFEPDFAETLVDVVGRGLLTATTETPAADAYIVAVPTPFNDKHELDPSYIKSAAEGIADKLSGGELVVLESDLPARNDGEARRLPDLPASRPHARGWSAELALLCALSRARPAGTHHGRARVE